jgi:hypothetical protein
MNDPINALGWLATIFGLLGSAWHLPAYTFMHYDNALCIARTISNPDPRHADAPGLIKLFLSAMGSDICRRWPDSVSMTLV